ncbi:MAG: TlpA disulfide reductase family protein [Pirellulales bacterium]
MRQSPSFLAAAAGSAADGSPAVVQLPTNPAAWINSQPLSNEMLAGKTAYLYFFEEGCPSCVRRWPELMEAAKKFTGKPIVFIAVNSGTARRDVQLYVDEVHVTWPVIVDEDRSFEKALGVDPMISLQNIYQATALMPDGRWQDTSTDIAGTAPGLLTDAKWRVEPSEVPDLLKSAWLQVEFGNFNGAAMLVKRNLQSPKSDVKAAAEKLQAAVTKERDTDLAAAKTADEGGRKWDAYKKYQALVVRFKSYDVPADAHASIRTLAVDPAVRNELAANKLWESAARQFSPTAPPSKGATAALQRIVTQHPDTEAARNAQAVLDRAATPGQ